MQRESVGGPNLGAQLALAQRHHVVAFLLGIMLKGPLSFAHGRLYRGYLHTHEIAYRR